MTTQTTIPYDWIRSIPHALLEKDEIPLLSSPGAFPLDALTAFLKKTFQLEQLSIEVGSWESRADDALLKGLGAPTRFVNIQLSPVEGTVTWAISGKDLHLLMSIILTKEPRYAGNLDKEYLEGFFEFVVLETLLALNRSQYDKGLTPHIVDTTTEPSKASLCLDTNILCNGVSLLGRLILSEEFRHSWKDRYTQHKMTVHLPPNLAEKLQVTVHLESGRTRLTRQEWQAINPGDYLILDQCSIEPGTGKGRVLLTLNHQTLFRAKIKSGSLKILESPLYQEVETVMNNDDDDDDYFDESEFDEETGDLSEESEIEATEEHTLSDEVTPAPTEKKPREASSNQITKGNTLSSTLVSPNDLDMTITVEVGRIQISVQKLVDMQPGNLLELDVHPEDGVDLVVNGKCIARGELLRIGDLLGVRILDKA